MPHRWLICKSHAGPLLILLFLTIPVMVLLFPAISVMVEGCVEVVTSTLMRETGSSGVLLGVDSAFDGLAG
jgi:hypothetical protein